MRKHRLIEIEWPEFGRCEAPPKIEAAEYQARLEAARAAMAARGLTHLVVYGDREHFANLLYLTGFDPRFEEALLVLRLDTKPLLLVGNECEGYLTVSPLFNDGALRHELYQSFSLIGQPRGASRAIREICAAEGIGPGAQVGCAGWKYFSEAEQPDAAHSLEVPAWLVDALRALAGHEAVVNATDMFMHPDYGLRATCSATEIAFLEYSAILASEGMKRMLFGIRDGMVDYELAKLAGFNGQPLCCHMTMATGDNRERGLSSPIGATIRRGDPLCSNFGYWGSNVCRAGWVADSPADLPADARDYVPAFAGVYFEVMGEWFRRLRLGTPGGELYKTVMDALPFETFGITLNPGHLIHLDEWLSSPIYPESTLPIRSGMAIQVDVIPSSPVYFSTRMEDGLAIADAGLRRELEEKFPDCYARCQARRTFMTGTLGFELAEEVLPLANIPAIVPPFFLAPNTVFALEP